MIIDSLYKIFKTGKQAKKAEPFALVDAEN